MTVGTALARGVGHSPRGVTKRVGVVAIAAVAVGGVRELSRTTGDLLAAGERPLQPDEFQPVDCFVVERQRQRGAPRHRAAP